MMAKSAVKLQPPANKPINITSTKITAVRDRVLSVCILIATIKDFQTRQ